MDAAKWSQGFQDHTNLVKPMEEMISNSCNRPPTMEKKAKPPEQLNCPRCNSTNTKFCYYNNYSLTQPRYFCKTCRRYWTEGGSLRNVPVGGGSRKNKRSSSSSSSSSTHKIPDLNPQLFPSQNPKDISTSISTPKGQDLNLAFPSMHEGSHGNFSQFLHGSKIEHHHHNSNTLQHSSSSSSPSFSPAFELLRSDGMGSFVPGSSVPGLFPSGFPMQDYKPSLSFSIDGFGNRNPNGVQDNGGRVFFPFGDQMKSTNSGEMEQNKGQGNNNNNSSSGYWNNGVLGGGSWQ